MSGCIRLLPVGWAGTPPCRDTVESSPGGDRRRGVWFSIGASSGELAGQLGQVVRLDSANRLRLDSTNMRPVESSETGLAEVR